MNSYFDFNKHLQNLWRGIGHIQYYLKSMKQSTLGNIGTRNPNLGHPFSRASQALITGAFGSTKAPFPPTAIVKAAAVPEYSDPL
jgi:hypothetical protein